MKFNRENNYRKQEIEGMQKINSEVLKEVKHTVDGSKNEMYILIWTRFDLKVGISTK